MPVPRNWWVVIVLLTLMIPADATAQGRGRGGEKQKHGGGPKFCRTGQGHPVFGWEWCEQRGWARAGDPLRRAYPEARRYLYPDRDRFPDREANRRYGDAAFDNGYADGYQKGLDDGRDRREYDPVRHGWYREADRGYDSRYGSRAQYQNLYRDGFRSGYEAGYRDGDRSDGSGGLRLPWPF